MVESKRLPVGNLKDKFSYKHQKTELIKLQGLAFSYDLGEELHFKINFRIKFANKNICLLCLKCHRFLVKLHLYILNYLHTNFCRTRFFITPSGRKGGDLSCK